MTKITLDYIDNIILDTEASPLSNPHALNFLPQGLFRLAQTIRLLEGQINPNEFRAFFSMDPIVPCSFHWFSSSLVNYVRLVGLVKVANENSWNSGDLVSNRVAVKRGCGAYAKAIIPEIILWRNKVSAHFAPTDPYDSDNPATLEQTVMNDIVSANGRYYASGMTLGSHGAESELPSWSLTERYQSLVPRYWPSSVLSTDPSKSIRPDWLELAPPRP